MSLKCPDKNTYFESMVDCNNDDEFDMCYNCCYIKKQHIGYIKKSNTIYMNPIENKFLNQILKSYKLPILLNKFWLGR